MREEGREAVELLLGGVWDLVPSCTFDVRADIGKLCSGDIVGGVAWGIEFSKSSARSNVENVRLASSAAAGGQQRARLINAQIQPTLLKVKFTVRRSLLLSGRRGRRAILVQKTKAGLQVLPRSRGNEAGTRDQHGQNETLGRDAGSPVAVDSLPLSMGASARSGLPCLPAQLPAESMVDGVCVQAAAGPPNVTEPRSWAGAAGPVAIGVTLHFQMASV